MSDDPKKSPPPAVGGTIGLDDDMAALRAAVAAARAAVPFDNVPRSSKPPPKLHEEMPQSGFTLPGYVEEDGAALRAKLGLPFAPPSNRPATAPAPPAPSGSVAAPPPPPMPAAPVAPRVAPLVVPSAPSPAVAVARPDLRGTLNAEWQPVKMPATPFGNVQTGPRGGGAVLPGAPWAQEEAPLSVQPATGDWGEATVAIRGDGEATVEQIEAATRAAEAAAAEERARKEAEARDAAAGMEAAAREREIAAKRFAEEQEQARAREVERERQAKEADVERAKKLRGAMYDGFGDD